MPLEAPGHREILPSRGDQDSGPVQIPAEANTMRGIRYAFLCPLDHARQVQVASALQLNVPVGGRRMPPHAVLPSTRSASAFALLFKAFT